MKLSGSLVLLLLLLAAAAAQESQARYVDSAGDFSFVVPSGWKIADSPGSRYKTVRGPRANDFTPNITTVDETFKGALSDYVTLSQRELEASSKGLGYEGLRLLRRAEFGTDAGPAGIKITNEFKARGREFIFSLYIFDGKGSTKLIFTCASLAADAAANERLCDASMKTLTIVK